MKSPAPSVSTDAVTVTHPHKCPLPNPVLVLTLWLSSEVPFLDPSLDPSVVAAQAGALVSRGSGLVDCFNRFSSVVLWGGG